MKRILAAGLMLVFASFSLALAPSAAEPDADQNGDTLPALAEPFPILAAGAPISVDTGHAAPFVYDFNKDGKKDLIVGQFGGGTARIYLNHGTDAAPEFGDFTLLQAAGRDAAMQPG